MKPTHIYAVHPAGYLVEFLLDEGEHLADAVETLVEREYRPSHGDAWPRTPEGVPICPKHREVMSQREKQGDTWYSHKMTDANGEVLYCRGYPGKSSPGWEVPGRRVGAQTPAKPQQQPAAQQQRPTPPQPRDEPPGDATPAGDDKMSLPDYRQLSIDATTDHAFDYAAYMVLKNGVYDSVERVAKTRMNLIPDWKPSPQANAALLLALEVYRDKRAGSERRGEGTTAAHNFAKHEALTAYRTMLQE